MARIHTAFICSECKFQSRKWNGQCFGCKAWNTLEQEEQQPTSSYTAAKKISLTPLAEGTSQPLARMPSSIKEWDRVLGGGLIPGSFVMLTGDPGIGKSTLLLQIAHFYAETYKVFYFSSEESREQVRGRAERLNCLTFPIFFSDQTHIERIIATAETDKPHIVIIDSLQNCVTTESDTSPGTIGQLRSIAFKLLRLAKEHTVAIILSGHVTKEGTIAGPKLLEHMVDAVFYLQGEDRWQTRILRSVKNRFGTIDEIGFFEMHETGLAELPNFNQQVLEHASEAPGSVLVSSLEGTRPLLVELQALTIASHFTMPQRLISGIDQKQVILIAAILEKYLKIKFSGQDIFFKIGGGLKLKGIGADLGIALALLSSYFQQPIPPRWIALGEINLTGEIKPINQIASHVNEARKFGIDKICLAAEQRVDIPRSSVRAFKNVYDLLSLFSLETS